MKTALTGSRDIAQGIQVPKTHQQSQHYILLSHPLWGGGGGWVDLSGPTRPCVGAEAWHGDDR